MKQKFSVGGMSCSACSAAVEKAVRRLDGMSSVSVSLTEGVMIAEFDETKVSNERIIQAIVRAGYTAALYQKGVKTEVKRGNMRLRLLISLIFMLLLMYVSMGHMLSLPLPRFFDRHENPIAFVLLQLTLALPVLWVNRKFFIVGYKALFHRSPNMDTLVAIGSTAAMLYGIAALVMIIVGTVNKDGALVQRYVSNLYIESAAMILTLVTVGKLLEDRSKKKTGAGIRALSALAPKTASVLREGKELLIPADEVAIGDHVLIRPGEKLPVDGKVIEGESELDLSALTGESMPIGVKVGDEVMTASVNLTGRFVLQATRVGEDTTLSKIIETVENASATKAPIARLADKVSGVFVPIVMTIALISGLVWFFVTKDPDTALNHLISVLVISCPCALGLATPVALTVAIGRYASKGIFVKEAASVEAMAHIDTVILDKTGTVTVGMPTVTDTVVLKGSLEEALSLAASLERHSEHSLSKAIVKAATEKDLVLSEIENFEALAGRGVTATMNGARLFCGNLAFMKENGVPVDDCEAALSALSSAGKTAVILAKETEVIALFGIADAVKATSKSAIDRLKEEKVSLTLLTGDRYTTAEAVAKDNALLFDEIIADVLPTEKADTVLKKLSEGRHVAMVGDGINDAPALATATVGIAVGSGTDIALESADIVLLSGDLSELPYAVSLSKKTLKRIKENLFWAFFYNSVGIPIAAGILSPLGIVLSPMLASLAMSLSSLFVVTNSLRLYRA